MSRFVNMCNEPSLMGVLKVLKDNIFDTLCCVKIGYIDSYDYETRVSRVVIYNKRVIGLNDKGEHILEDYPPLYCKTLFLGGKDCGINWDIKQGDECIVFFTDKELETPWISGQVSDIKYGRMHNYTDAICLTGFTTLPKATPTGKDIKIHNEINEVNINSGDNINMKSNLNIILDAPNVETTGNLKVATGVSAMIPCNNATLVFTNGILTGVS